MRLFAPISVILAALALAAGCAVAGFWAGAALGVGLGLLWLAAQRRGWEWAGAPAFVGLVGLAAFGAWSGLPAAWMLIGAISALTAWDLDRFWWRLRGAGRVVGEQALVRAHLLWLASVAGLGLLLGGAALAVQLDLGFGWALLAGALALLGLGQVIRAVRGLGE
jgi:hypothetical protein